MKLAYLTLFLLSGAAAFAQETRTFTLKPIEIAPGPRYFYGGRRLIGSMEALQVPFLELNDEQVLRTYRTANGLRIGSRVVSVVPLAYLLFRGRNVTFRREDYWTVFWATVAVSVGLDIGRNFTVRKAIRLYNERLPAEAYGRGSLGLSVQPTPVGTVAPALNLALKF